MKNFAEVIAQLKKEFPGKTVISNPQANPTEIICEVEPTSQNPDRSVAIAFIKQSEPHRHSTSVETYAVEAGKLDLYLDGIKKNLKTGQSFTIRPEIIHWAKGNWARVKVVSKPGWTAIDHVTIEKAVSAGGLVMNDNKIPFVKFTNGTVTFPKGHIEKGETRKAAALREVREETGLESVRVIKKLGVVTRPGVEPDGRIVIKDIHLFLMETESLVQGEHDREIVWLTVNEALPKLMTQEAEFLSKCLSSGCLHL